MKTSIALFMILASSAFAWKNKKGQNEIVESRNVPLAITTFAPKKVHEVKAHWRLAFFSLRLKPFITQSFDRSRTMLGIEVTTTSSWGEYVMAQIVLTADGKQIYSSMHDWATSSGAEQTIITDVNLIHKISSANVVYLTVAFTGSAPPFDHMSFQISPEQLEDVRLMLALFDSMQANPH